VSIMIDPAEIVHQFDLEGFKVEVLYPFIVGKRRKILRFIVYSVSDRTVTLHDTFKIEPLGNKGDILSLEVIFKPVKADSSISHQPILSTNVFASPFPCDAAFSYQMRAVPSSTGTP
jgi:hypothetical protein